MVVQTPVKQTTEKTDVKLHIVLGKQHQVIINRLLIHFGETYYQEEGFWGKSNTSLFLRVKPTTLATKMPVLCERILDVFQVQVSEEERLIFYIDIPLSFICDSREICEPEWISGISQVTWLDEES